MKIKFIILIFIILALLVGLMGCSSKNAECKVTYDRDGNLDIIVNPPGESGESSQKGTLTRNTSISASEGSMSKVTIYSGEIEKSFSESGNSYTIDVNITIEGDRLTAYQLTVTGGVYGETPHTCTNQ